MSEKQVKGFKAPSPILILVCVIIFCAIASYVIPAGVYERVKDVHTGKMVVDPATFHYVAQKPTGFLDFFTSINKGFKGGITIIAFLFMVGGSLNILAKTGAIVAGLSTLVKKMRNHSILLIPVLMTTLATFSTLAGCNEEYLAFTPLVVSVALALGFDSLTALGMLFCSVAAGYGAAARSRSPSAWPRALPVCRFSPACRIAWASSLCCWLLTLPTSCITRTR